MELKVVKNIFLLCVFVLSGLITSPAFALEAINQEYQINQSTAKTLLHTVTKGETVYSIAKAYNVPVEEVYQLNPSASSGIRVGENLILPRPAVGQSTPVNKIYYHKVKPKETLYSIAKEFGVSVDDIVNLNSELKTKPLVEGQIIQLFLSKKMEDQAGLNTNKPVHFIQHKVLPQETIYGISKKYATTPEILIAFNPLLKDTLKEGSIILIPLSDESLVGQNSLLDVEGLSIGIVLPFVNETQSQGARFLEYYEGLLLALEDMKTRGFSANVYVFDIGSETGTTKLKSLLETNELQNLDLIIGGVSTEQVNIISNFTQRHSIKYVVPFPTTSTVVETNPNVFQVNETQALLIDGVAKAFVSRFADSNVILITSQEDKKAFVRDLSRQLAETGVSYKSVVANANIQASLTTALDLSKRNVIVVASGTQSVLKTILPALNTIQTEKPLANITLFGQPEWQTYNQYINEYSKYDTYIYTAFFLDDYNTETKQFIADYKAWYNNKSIINTYPRYALLGYDTGLYFFNALMKYGKNFQNSLSTNPVTTLQTPFAFKRTSATGGYLNTGFYFVHYGTAGYIQKIAYAQW